MSERHHHKKEKKAKKHAKKEKKAKKASSSSSDESGKKAVKPKSRVPDTAYENENLHQLLQSMWLDYAPEAVAARADATPLLKVKLRELADKQLNTLTVQTQLHQLYASDRDGGFRSLFVAAQPDLHIVTEDFGAENDLAVDAKVRALSTAPDAATASVARLRFELFEAGTVPLKTAPLTRTKLNRVFITSRERRETFPLVAKEGRLLLGRVAVLRSDEVRRLEDAALREQCTVLADRRTELRRLLDAGPPSEEAPPVAVERPKAAETPAREEKKKKKKREEEKPAVNKKPPKESGPRCLLDEEYRRKNEWFDREVELQAI